MEITPVLSIDKYSVGKGETGTITQVLHKMYLDAVRGKIEEFKDWVMPIY